MFVIQKLTKGPLCRLNQFVQEHMSIIQYFITRFIGRVDLTYFLFRKESQKVVKKGAASQVGPTKWTPY